MEFKRDLDQGVSRAKAEARSAKDQLAVEGDAHHVATPVAPTTVDGRDDGQVS